MNDVSAPTTPAQLPHFQAAVLRQHTGIERTKRWRWSKGQSIPTVLLLLVHYPELLEALLADARTLTDADATKADAALPAPAV